MIFFHDMAINLMAVAAIKKYDGVNMSTKHAYNNSL